MLDYYGISLLNELQEYYLPRFRLAEERGYAVQGNKYYWFFEELQARIAALRQAILFLEALPKFMVCEDEYKPFQFVVGYVGKLFTVESIGEIARNDQDIHPFFNDNNPYWLDLQESLDHFNQSYDLKNLPLLYVDLSEYVVRGIRLYLQIREARFKAVDRGKLDELMHMKSLVRNAG